MFHHKFNHTNHTLKIGGKQQKIAPIPVLPIFLAPVCGGVKSAMKQPARSQDPLSMNGLGRALWNFLVLPTKKNITSPIFSGVVHILGLPTVLLDI